MYQKTLNKYLFLFLVTGMQVVVHAQTLEADLQAVSARIEAATALSIHADVTVYQRKGGSQIYAARVSQERSGKRSLNVLGEVETFSDGTHQVIVDHESKTLQLSKKPASTDTQLGNFDVKQFKKLMEREGSSVPKPVVSLLSNTDGVRTYQISGAEGFDDMQLVLDMNAGTIRKMTYTYASKGPSKGQYCVIQYVKFDLQPVFGAAHFKLSNYVVLSNKTYQPAGRFSTYQFHADL